MGYRVVEVGYKIIKIGKHAASCSLSCLSNGRFFLHGSVAAATLTAGIGLVPMSAFANDLVGKVALNSGDTFIGDFDGELGRGFLITGDERFGGAPTVTFGDAGASDRDATQSLVHNFSTVGGNGSGGGAGLGGVFFIDTGATLTVYNTDFKSNMVSGGRGGSGPVIRVSDQVNRVTGQTTSVFAASAVAAAPILATVSGNTYTFNSLKVGSEAAPLLMSGARLNFGVLGTQRELKTIVSSDRTLQLDAPLQVNRLTFLDSYRPYRAEVRDGLGTLVQGELLEISGFLRGGSKTILVQGEKRADALDGIPNLSDIAIGSVIAIPGAGDFGRPFTTTVRSIEYDDVGLSKIVVDDFLPDVAFSQIDILPSLGFSAALFNETENTNEYRVLRSIGSFAPGMVVSWTDDNNETQTARVVGASAYGRDGQTIELDKELPASVTSFNGTKSPIINETTIELEDASARFKEKQDIVILNAEGEIGFRGSIKSINGNSVELQGEGDALADLYDPFSGLTVVFPSASYRDGELTFVVSDPSLIEEGMSVVGAAFGDDTEVESIVVNLDGSVTISLSEVIDDAENIGFFKLVSPLTKGGSMNSFSVDDFVAGKVDEPQDGEDGRSADRWTAIFEELGGGAGNNGQSADDPKFGTGFDGGNGGNGSAAPRQKPGLVYETVLVTFEFTKAINDVVQAGLDLAGAINPDPVLPLGVAVPDPITITAKAFGLGFSIAELVFKTTSLGLIIEQNVKWEEQIAAGLVGHGGEGGQGGEASGGADFFGGGAGGDGGNGGDGAASTTHGGDAGDGGRGGDGGFGAGGGSGGQGGEGGRYGNAYDGDPGDGGFAGFGAGEGANGNGWFGGGGDGLGGAIFLREGGTFILRGNSLFELNTAAGGTTSSFNGAAGMAAGTDLFMMKGSTVSLEPGFGKEIIFEGSIADDSRETGDDFMNAAGDGADIYIRGSGGLVVFNGENSYSGNTILEGASLTAELGTGISDSSLIRFNGAGVSNALGGGTLSLQTAGTLLLQENYVRRAGILPFQTSWTGSGGFASGLGEGVTVTLGQLDEETGRGQNLLWGANGFFVGGGTGAGPNGTLTFGSELSVGSVTFTNDVDLNEGGNVFGRGGVVDGRIAVYNTRTFETSTAYVSGQWSNGRLLVGDARRSASNEANTTPYMGTLFMTGDNELTGLEVASGRVSTYNAGNKAGVLFADVANLIVRQDAQIDSFGSESLASAAIVAGGVWLVANDIAISQSLENGGRVVVLGHAFTPERMENSPDEIEAYLRNSVADGGLGLSYLEDEFEDWSGALDVTGDLVNNGLLHQFGDLKVAGNASNSVLWKSLGQVVVSGDFVNTGVVDFTADPELADEAYNVLVSGQLDNSNVLSLTGATRVGSVSNSALLTLDGKLSVDTALENTGRIQQSGSVVVVGHLTNMGSWNNQADSSIAAKTLSGGGTFLLSSLIEQEIETDVGPQITLVEGVARELALSLSDDSVFAGVFDGKGDLVISGTGTLELSADQTFDGELTVEAGGVVANGTMSDELDIVVDLGAFYTANVTDTVNSVWNAGTFNLGAGADFITRQGFRNGSPNTLVMAADVTTLNGIFQNDGRTVVSGERVLTIGAADGVVTGLTGNADGDFQIAAGNSLTIDQEGDSAYAGKISRVGSTSGYFAKAGSGVLTLSGPISVLDIRIQGGSLALNGANIIDAGAGVDISDSASLVLVTGDQSINRLTGSGLVELGLNRLLIENGGDFSGTITGKGTVDVQTGDFTVSGVLDSDEALFEVQTTSTTAVNSTAVLNVGELMVYGTLDLKHDANSMAQVMGQKATITGTLKGTGMIAARTIVQNGGQLSPGASPGHLLFDDLTLASGSTTTMELYGATVDDMITVNEGGKLTIEGTADLVIDADYQPPLGEVTRIFTFDTGAITGLFENVSPAAGATDRVVLNLATGSVVGLGARTLPQLEALAITPNERAMYDGLLVNDDGGIAQFYGGRFVENLTAAWDADGDTSAVFDKASPEVYAGLSASAEAAAMNSASDWVGGFVGKDGVTGSFFDASRSQYTADDSGLGYKSFGVQSTNTNVGLNVSSSDLTFLFSLGVASTKLESDYLNGTGEGIVMGAGFVGEIANSTETVWTAGLRQAILSIDGQRAANNGLVSFSNVDASATQFNLGVEHNGSNGQVDYGLRGSLELGSSKSNAFSETAGLNTFDAMAVDGVKNRYVRFNLGTKLASEITDGTSVVGSFDLSAPLSSSLVGVGASYDDGQGKFGVNSRGLDGVSFAATIGVDHETSEQGMISARIGAENTWNGDTALSASFSARVNF